MASADLRHYVLRGDEQGARRLGLLARIKWPTTKRLLRRVGLRSGMRCLDVGCGIGAVTLKMAQWVGPTGQVVGLDLDEYYLQSGRLEACRQKLPAVFRAENVSELREEAAYDLAFGRFLLTHLPQAERALERLVLATRPGGVVVVEDVEFAGHFSFPPCPAFERYVNLYQQVVRRRGGDPNIGPRLPGLLLDAGLERVRMEVVQPVFRTGPGKRFTQITLDHIRQAVVAAGLASDAELTSTVAELDSFASNPRTLMSLPRIFQAWGCRPERG